MNNGKLLFKQYMNVLAGHIVAVIAEAFLQLFLLGFLFMKDAFRPFGGVLFVIIYAAIIYCRAKKVAEADNKSYSVLKPSLKKGLLMGVMIAALTFLLFGIDKGLWAAFGSDGVISGVVPKICNVIFVVWIIPYYGFMGNGANVVTVTVLVLMAVIPVISSFLGYFAGCKGINITEKLNLSMYEKK